MSTNKILIGSVAVLVILNLFLIAPKIMHGFKGHKGKHHHCHETCKKKCDHHGDKKSCDNCQSRCDGEKKCHGKKHDKAHGFLKEKLGFTDEQIEKEKGKREEHKKFMKEKHETLKKLNEAYFNSIINNDTETKEATFAQINSIHKEIILKNYSMFNNMLSIVEDDKKDEAKELLINMATFGPHKQHKKKHHEHQGGQCSK